MKKALEGLGELIIRIIMECCVVDPQWLTLSDKWDGVTAMTGEIWNYISIFAIGLTLVYFLMEMNQKLALEGRDLNMKSFFAPFLKLMIAIAVLTKSGEILGMIINFNDKMITDLGAIAATVTPLSEDQYATLGASIIASLFTGGLFWFLIIFLLLILIFIIGNVLKLVWLWKATIYKLEVLFRVSLTPFAIADVYNGHSSTAIRYCKGFIALGLYGLSIVVLPSIALSLMANMGSSFASGISIAGDGVVIDFAQTAATGVVGIFDTITMLLNMLIAPFAALSASSAAKQIAKEALGC